ncbi:TonB-dependent receptor [Pseudomaricurvus alkylphenolicus]|uniref:TonB-dependent receptor n=1 Tax=Pseudomaricurvus alkylphenolicus TaxID=1306991 RepID=UPI0014222316|nr:TonB-dependent receptor [Pseudomaricurvus alkylphenolicus]NIB44894.1 TonB-dependent receptor [Pseudomaricurvus alkylphenolicus]
MKINKTLLSMAVSMAMSPVVVAEESTDNKADEFFLEEITVTASKRGEQNLMDVALPITAFSGDDLERQGAANLEDFINKTPGLTLTSVNPGNQVIQIRGISALVGDPTVGLYLDDVPFATAVNLEFPSIPSFDLAGVEVLRGPQGTLYGASSQGGTVIVKTQDASTTEFEGKLDVTGASIHNGEASYSINGAINLLLVEDVLGLRLVAGVNETGGYIDDSSVGKKNVNDTTLENFRAKLTYTPNDNLEIRLGAWFQDLEADGFNIADENLDRPMGAPTTALAPVTGIDSEYSAFDYDVYNMAVEYEFDAFRIYSATSYLEFEEAIFDASGLSVGVGYDNRTIENLSQEIRLVSKSDSDFSWTLGGLYNDNETTFLFTLAPGFPGAVDELVESKSWAVFGEGTWSFFDNSVDLTLGLRYFEDKRTDTELPSSLAVTGFPIAPGLVFPGMEAVGVAVKRDATFDTVQPKLNISWRPSDDSLLFFNAARGFRSGLVQPGGVMAMNIALGGFTPQEEVAEESVWSYEVGAKGTLLDGRLSYDTALYYNDWEDIQIFGAAPGVGIGFVFNGPTAQAYGLDWAFSYATALEGLTLSTTGNVNVSEYTSDASFLDVNGIVAPADVSDGDRIVNVPKFTFSASANYEFELTSLEAQGFAMLEVQYNSEREEPTSDFTAGKNTFVNARIGMERENYGIYLFGRNLTDESDAMYPAGIEAASLGFTLNSRPQPRTLGVNVKMNF